MPPQPMHGIKYSRRAHDLGRFMDDPADEAIATIVRAASVLSTEERDALRARLDADDCYTLLAFSRRRSAAGIGMAPCEMPLKPSRH